MTNYAKEILTTNGVGSSVYDDDGNIIGHVVLSDYDLDGGYLEDDIGKLGGITIVLKSSTAEDNENGIDKYHLWNLSIRSRENTALKLLELHGDTKQAALGWRRGRWTIRTTPKEFPKRGVYKPAPELSQVVVRESDAPQSRGHWNYAKAIWDIPEDVEPPPDIDLIGAAYDVERYLTLTDHGKKQVRE